MQKQRAVSGLQSELMGVIQRIQSIQYGGGLGGSAYLGGNFQLGAGGGLGGLPSLGGGGLGGVSSPPPLNTGR